MSEPTVGEPKPQGNYTARRVRKQRKVMGELRAYKTRDRRVSIFHLPRHTWDEFKAKQCWAIDADLIDAVRAFGCTHVCLEIEDGRRLLIAFKAVGRHGAEQGVEMFSRPPTNPKFPAERKWLVPEKLFASFLPPQDEREDALIETMKIKGNAT